MKRFEKSSARTSRASPELIDAYVRRGNRLRSEAVRSAAAGLWRALAGALAPRPRRRRVPAA